MTLLAVASPKGGVGKTTVALNLGCALARRGWRTLVVDTDPQGAIGFSVEGAGRKSPGLAAVIGGRIALADAVIPTNLEGLALLPVAGGESGSPLAAETSVEDADGLKRVLLAARNRYDVVVVDTPSGLSGPTVAVLEIADYLLVPLQAEPLALRSMPQILTRVATLREAGATVQLAGLVLTMLNSRDDVSLSVAQESWGALPANLVLQSVVPRDPAFLKASAHGVPLQLLSRRPPPVAAIFDQLAAEIEERLSLVPEEDRDEPLALLD